MHRAALRHTNKQRNSLNDKLIKFSALVSFFNAYFLVAGLRTQGPSEQNVPKCFLIFATHTDTHLLKDSLTPWHTAHTHTLTHSCTHTRSQILLLLLQSHSNPNTQHRYTPTKDSKNVAWTRPDNRSELRAKSQNLTKCSRRPSHCEKNKEFWDESNDQLNRKTTKNNLSIISVLSSNQSKALWQER